MKKLYHYPTCPFSRQVRVYLKELGVPFTMVKEDYWLERPEFIRMNPARILPVLEETSGLIITGIYSITEYFNDKYPKFNFFDEDSDINCEIRQMLWWFNDKFYHEVSNIFVNEKVIRLLAGIGSPRTDFLRQAKLNLDWHLNLISKMLEKRQFIASDDLSAADIAAASHVSIIDYFGEIYWDRWPHVKHWYSLLKSRPSFRPLLLDQIAGFVPPPNYLDLDF